MRFIPRKTKVKMELYRNFTVVDLIIAFLGVAGVILLFTANFPYHIYVGIAAIAFVIMLFMPVADDVKLYYSVVLMFKYMAYQKKYTKVYTNKKFDIKKIMPFNGVNSGKYLDFGDYFGMVLEIMPMQFFLMDEEKQDAVIATFGNALQRLTKDQRCSIYKIKKPMILDGMVDYEDKRYNTLLDMADRGLYGKKEVEARSPVFEERLSAISYLNTDDKIIKSHYYIVVYDKDREVLETTILGMQSSIAGSATPIASEIVEENELLAFLKATFVDDFDERELIMLSPQEQIKWTYPDELKIGVNTISIDRIPFRTFTITDYPINVPNAWAYPLFEMDDTRVVVNIAPIEKYKAEKMLDKSLLEMEVKIAKTGKASTKIEAETHYETLRELMTSLKNNGENLYNVNMHITAKESMKKEVRAQLKQRGFKYAENFGRQLDAFISANVSRRDSLEEYARGIQTSSIAAMFPFISNALQDDRGFYLGYNTYPVFTNFFVRNNERVNSNMMVIGKSGSGKSFCTKTVLTNMAADNTRVFILDPENEYEILCRNLGGKMIDVGSSINGIFNPFHIFATLESDEGQEDDSFNGHLQFLEQFYRVILPGLNSDAFEMINSLTIQLYKKKGIDKYTQLNALEPKDYPIFDDFMELINERITTETDEYHIRNLRTIKLYIEKFATGGRNSNLWNGPTSIETNENFICFNFRSLVANNNDIVTNAQMLLVFKYLNNEIIKNRDFNLKYFADEKYEEDHRRVIVAVDEAHVFVNAKYPVALDFMAQMAKRIRKYYGMEIVITQNIKDFVGSEAIQQQSTAIINACQYSMIFALAPNDITDLITLYRNAGGINKEEQDSIVTAGRGQCFLITSAMNRTTVKVDALKTVRNLFERRD